MRDPSFRREFIDRLREACSGVPFSGLAASTGFNRETIRRYWRGECAIPVEFVAAVCREYGLAPLWLLLGEGPSGMQSLDPGGTGVCGAIASTNGDDRRTASNDENEGRPVAPADDPPPELPGSFDGPDPQWPEAPLRAG